MPIGKGQVRPFAGAPGSATPPPSRRSALGGLPSLAQAGSGRPQKVVHELQWAGGNGGDELLALLKKNIRIKSGGNVQLALGSR